MSEGSRNDAYPPGLFSATVVTGPPRLVLTLKIWLKFSSKRPDEGHAAEDVQRRIATVDGPVLSAIVLNVPLGFERKIPPIDVSLRPLSKAIWPSSLSDTRDERLLKLNPSGVGVSQEPPLERSVPRSDEEPVIERSSSSGTMRDLAQRVDRLVGDEELGDEVAAGRVDGVRDRGERPAATEEDALAAFALLRRPALRRRVVSRRRFPWKATSPSSLIDGSEGRLLNPLSQKVGKSAIDAVAAMTSGEIVRAALGDDLRVARHGVPHRHRHRAQRVDGRAARGFEAVALAVQDRS